jgi:hypothetical protein
MHVVSGRVRSELVPKRETLDACLITPTALEGNDFKIKPKTTLLDVLHKVHAAYRMVNAGWAS